MKKSLAALICLLVLNLSFAQEKKYPSLLWEISKDNNKPSYLYGTMHVSERIAFHLSDVFFEKLLSTDKVALESNPETWLDELQNSPGDMVMGMNPYGQYQFYKSFQRSPLKNELLKQSFMFNDFMLNGILYRTNDSFNDYQEDTYLDMFIYQVGKRTNRTIVNLEEYKESRQLVEKAFLSNSRFDPPAWAKKMSKDKPMNILMEDAYREKNLDMIDSINRGMNSPDYNKFMLFERNGNMVKRMDSIFKKGETLFIGIGAAHLPGHDGVIEMLREKGYTVKPVSGDYTIKGRGQKDKLDHAFQYFNYTNQTTSDGILTLAAPSKLYEFEFPGMSMAASPDLKNGAYVNVIRLKNYDFLRKNNYTSSLTKIDSLLYEYIPGNITKKEKIKINGFDAFDISNKTKEGDSQRYWIISTPLEYLIISVLGKSEFVENQSKNMLASIKIKNTGNNWEKVSPIQGGYSVQVPSYHNIVANDKFGSLMGNPEILAHDKTDGSYYFVIEKTLNDIEYLEETEFELKRIQYEFYKKLKIDSTNGKFSQNPLTYTSQSKLNDNKTIRLKSVIHGSHYYLLGTVSNETKTKQFFDSFKLENFNYYREPKMYKDTILNYTVKTQIDPGSSEIDYEYYYKNHLYNSDKNHFEGSNKSRTISSESKQNIIVNYRKFPRYGHYETIDSLWNTIVKNNRIDFEFEAFNKKTYKNDDGKDVMDVYFKKPESAQIVKTRYIASDLGYHSIKTLVDNDYKGNDPYIERFFNDFTPSDSVNGISIFEQKTNLFLNDIESEEDSIRSSALKSVHYIKFKDEDFPALSKLIENFEFEEDESYYKNSLIAKIGELNHPQTNQFLINYYHKNSGDSNLQLGVIEAFTKKKNKQDYKTILKLMDEDLPLPSSSHDLFGTFGSMAADPENSAKIIGDLLKYRSIPEYQNHIISLTAYLMESGKLAPRKIRPYRKDILTLAKLELKRTTSNWMDSKRSQTDYYEYTTPTDISLLKSYITLLQPFSHEKENQEFFQKVEKLDIPELLLFTLDQKLEADDNVSDQLIKKISKEKNSQWELYEILKRNNKLDKFPKEISKEHLALSVLIGENGQINEKEDSIKFLTTKNAAYKNKSYEIYFFKIKTKNIYTGIDMTEVGYTAFELDKDNTFKISTKKEKEKETNLILEEVYETAEVAVEVTEIAVEAGVQYDENEDDSVFSHSGIEYIDDEYLEETYKSEIDRVLFHNKKRVSFESDYYGGYLGY
ncbi:TraB/GumN family protein [Moheibacter sediminis]|uniref:Uncharacterized conserved protein YbaP, TraB family n=1 Tax=Moheibacter sediminis TaxID=1434700 RepID=A0A1W2BUK9_9FLAO|nr:TraB/GumN family protein [Moheibacter sediminis]SMC76424.1 Uncharacterized conserved protein YbaP, TraB family [Moheibacter sediminis]